tara:strand:- start:264 stop:458 length:195 start_codon:yes stop_codon:yes gene_type:complete
MDKLDRGESFVNAFDPENTNYITAGAATEIADSVVRVAIAQQARMLETFLSDIDKRLKNLEKAR